MLCIAVDDEPISLALLCSFVRRTPSLELLGSFTDPREAVAAIQQRGCDLLLLDLHMPHLHGFDVLRQLAEPPVAIVTTAHSQHAVASYELDVADYLMKPFAYERFLSAIERAQTKHALQRNASITLRSGHVTMRIPIAEITHVEAFDDYVKVYRTGQRPIVALSTLNAIEDQFPKDRFPRIHRSYIVNWTRVTQVKNRRVRVSNVDIPIGNTYWRSVKERMERDREAGASSPEETAC